MDTDLSMLIPIQQVVIVGHVDVGKSSLTGKVLYHFGDRELLNKRLRDIRSSMEGKQMNAAAASKGDVENPTTELRFLCDKSSHERLKGNTINYHSSGVTLSHPGLEPRFFNFCDAPGHVEFTKNFVAGSTQADIALMLLPASQLALASSMKPMKEKGSKGKESDDLTADKASGKKLPSVLDHQLRILNTFGVKTLLICVNKMAGGATSHTGNETGSTSDIVPYDEEMYTRIVNTATEIIKKNGFKESWFYFMPIDVFNSDNLWSKSPNMPWWKGIDYAPKGNAKCPAPAPFHADCLVEFLLKVPVPERDYKAPLKMCIQNIYNISGQGQVFSCKIFAGLCKPEQPVIHCPVYYNTKIKSIEVFNEKRACVGVGDECAVTLYKVDSQRPPIKGHVLCAPDVPLSKVVSFVAKVQFLGVQEVVKAGFTCTWNCHVEHCTVIVERILDSHVRSVNDLKLKGTEPECISWNPVLTNEQVNAAKELQRKKKQDAKFKLTDQDEKLLNKYNNPYTFDPCGNEYLDSHTTELVGGRENKACLIRFRPMDPIICTNNVTNTGMSRFCLTASKHIIGIGMITQVKVADTVEQIKKIAAKSK